MVPGTYVTSIRMEDEHVICNMRHASDAATTLLQQQQQQQHRRPNHQCHRSPVINVIYNIMIITMLW